MNRPQKIAWYSLIVIFSVLTLTALTVATLNHLYGLPTARSGLGVLGFLGLLGCSPIFFRKKPGKIDIDERDTLIIRKARLGAHMVFWLLFVAGCMVPWALIGPQGSITVSYLPLMLICGFLIVVGIESVTIIILYGRGGERHE